MSEISTQSQGTAAPQAEKRETPDVLDQLMKPEVQESLTILVDNLPKLAEMVTVMTKAFDLAQSVSKDQVLIEDLKGGMQEFVKPITEKAKGVAAAAIEAGDRAQVDTSSVGLFGMLKMLKDPQVQKSLRFVQAFLDIQAKRQ
ncbi:DUF1641 domain-containing protein [Paenibacillus pini]|uniref:DUF1641 domain-containing protein n=1 Tax=Paenibacillus pini JCM 16418 TaxID=1236976 RepID=W7Y9K3_9BACL|nr:DUF1641 domain-containing protein [Paenibacillus pini]GAF07695.1 hypothetical protein JCM16418_1723 [Paenibacillus pini JCM 16418]